jgi:hypothetical protein
VRFQVLTAAATKMTALWDIVLCSLVEVDQRFRGVYCLHRQRDHRQSSSRLYGAISQKAVIFKYNWETLLLAHVCKRTGPHFVRM